ncbi:MAG: HEAT repeat domain-containing protein [Elusimicrobiota bacterium]|nr:HEAT repeat domain-containing protein [Elusimicrobiota bacterium]
MNSTFKNLTLTAALLSFSVSANAATGVTKLFSERNDPAKAAELKALAASDSQSAQTLLAEALRTDKDPDYRCSAIEALGASKDGLVAKELAGLLNDPDQAVRACAIRSAGELKNEFAVESLLATVESYQKASRGRRGPYEDNIRTRLKAIDSIWSLGEIGDPRLMAKLSQFYAEADDIVKMNLIISMGKLKKNGKSGPYLFDIAASAQETEVVRAVAFEMLEQIGYPSTVINLQPSKSTGIEKGDIIYTGGIIGTIGSWGNPDLPIGHAGLFAGTAIKNGKINVIITDCVPNNFKPGGVRNIYSWKNFTHQYMYPYYGNRTTPVKPTAEQRVRLVKLGLELGAKGLKYSNTHFSQKGPTEFDCVGYIEYIYERIGLNPTDNSYETGLGWPLTPWEQFEATRPNTPAPGVIILPNNGNIIVPHQAIITQGFRALTGAFGMEAAQAPEVDTNIQPEAVN